MMSFLVIRVLMFLCWSYIAPFFPELCSPVAGTAGPRPDCAFARPVPARRLPLARRRPKNESSHARLHSQQSDRPASLAFGTGNTGVHVTLTAHDAFLVVRASR